MEDTTREIRAVQQKIWMTLPEAERFRKCGEMFEVAKTFAIGRAPKGLTRPELSRFVFKELYGFEMPEDSLIHIIV